MNYFEFWLIFRDSHVWQPLKYLHHKDAERVPALVGRIFRWLAGDPHVPGSAIFLLASFKFGAKYYTGEIRFCDYRILRLIAFCACFANFFGPILPDI